MTDVGKACALRRGRSGHREIVTFIEVDDRSRDSRDRHELGPSRKYLNEVKALHALVRHPRVPQPGCARNRQGASRSGHVRQPMTEVINPAWGFLARSKRGTRPMPAWLFGGTRQRRIQFCSSGWEETKEGAAV